MRFVGLKLTQQRVYRRGLSHIRQANTINSLANTSVSPAGASSFGTRNTREYGRVTSPGSKSPFGTALLKSQIAPGPETPLLALAISSLPSSPDSVTALRRRGALIDSLLLFFNKMSTLRVPLLIS